MISILIADDQELVRGGFRVVLDAQDDLQVVGETEDGRQAVELARELHPDVVLMDIRMPVLDGIGATRSIRAAAAADAGPRVLVLTTFDLDEYVYEAIRSGASGFLLKDVRAAQLIDAVRTVASGDALIAPSITRRLIAEFAARPLPVNAAGRFDELTPRELEVLTLVARGLSNAEIARELFVGDATIKTHLTRILMKLNLRDRVQAVVLAYESGLITPGTSGHER
jgi:DNA-binding NarL/FixJ family response regulator